MKAIEKSGGRRGWIARAAGVFLIAAFALLAYDFSGCARLNISRASDGSIPSLRTAAAGSESADPSRIKSYFLDFAGDHSLNVATVTEQAANGRANYTVQLRLASGAEQSVVVAGPPGGLRIEMQDMTGDHVPNDVVLRPALLHWPPTVLVNDGHDHFAVVLSGADPGSFSSRQNLDSRRRDNQTFAFLRSSGFKAVQLPHSTRMLVPQSQQSLLSPFTQLFAWGIEHASSSGRAPPFVTTT